MKTVSNIIRDKKYNFRSSVQAFLPRKAFVPLKKDGDENFSCIVNVGDTVSEGQIVGFFLNEDGSKKYVHASIPGKVESFETCSYPDGSRGTALKVKLSGFFSFLGKNVKHSDWNWYSPDEILDRISEKGVPNTFVDGRDLSSDIKNCKVQKGRFLVVRMFDDDPSYVTDSFVAEIHVKEILTGVNIVSKAMKASGIVFVLPKSKKMDIPDDIFGSTPVFKTTVDETKYPCGFVQNLVHAVKKAPKKDEKEKIFNQISQFGIFVDPETLYSVYEAVVLEKPVVEKFVHATGNALKSSAIFKVRLGCTVEDLMKQCGGFDKPLGKIVINGILTGDSVANMDTIITKDVKSVNFMPKKELEDQNRTACIRCGKCRTICPEGLYPDLIYRHSNGGKKIGKDMISTVELCSACTLCNTVCPSRLPLCQTIENLRKF